MDYLLYLMFRCDFDVMESLDVGEGGLWDLNTPRDDTKTMQDLIDRETVLSDSFLLLPLVRQCSACEPANAAGRQAPQETAEKTVPEPEMTNVLHDLFVLASQPAFWHLEFMCPLLCQVCQPYNLLGAVRASGDI